MKRSFSSKTPVFANPRSIKVKFQLKTDATVEHSCRKPPNSSSSENNSGVAMTSYGLKRGDLSESSLNSDTDSGWASFSVNVGSFNCGQLIAVPMCVTTQRSKTLNALEDHAYS